MLFVTMLNGFNQKIDIRQRKRSEGWRTKAKLLQRLEHSTWRFFRNITKSLHKTETEIEHVERMITKMNRGRGNNE